MSELSSLIEEALKYDPTATVMRLYRQREDAQAECERLRAENAKMQERVNWLNSQRDEALTWLDRERQTNQVLTQKNDARKESQQKAVNAVRAKLQQAFERAVNQERTLLALACNSQIEALKEKAEQDAARYRFIKEHYSQCIADRGAEGRPSSWMLCTAAFSGATLDEAIDAALTSKPDEISKTSDF